MLPETGIFVAEGPARLGAWRAIEKPASLEKGVKMRTTFFVPRGEACPIGPGYVIAGRLVIDQFVGNVTTPSYIGYTFTVRSLTFQERLGQVVSGEAIPSGRNQRRFIMPPVSQWDEVRAAG